MSLVLCTVQLSHGGGPLQARLPVTCPPSSPERTGKPGSALEFSTVPLTLHWPAALHPSEGEMEARERDGDKERDRNVDLQYTG